MWYKSINVLMSGSSLGKNMWMKKFFILLCCGCGDVFRNVRLLSIATIPTFGRRNARTIHRNIDRLNHTGHLVDGDMSSAFTATVFYSHL